MILILRLDHRCGRDERISTHCGLVARAFGADRVIYSGEHDKGIMESVNDISSRWGGSFKAEYKENWRKVIKEHKRKRFDIVHLTMYGMPLKKKITKIRKNKNVLVIVGGSKVPPEVYHLADFNVSVTSQPHSEVAALAVFLNEYFRGKEKKFGRAKIKIVPQEKGKKTIMKP